MNYTCLYCGRHTTITDPNKYSDWNYIRIQEPTLGKVGFGIACVTCPNMECITKDIYDKKHQELQDQMQLLEIEMSEHRKADYEYQNTVATVISVARRAKTFLIIVLNLLEKEHF